MDVGRSGGFRQFVQDVRAAVTLPVVIGALGYFVDIFDLVLFSMLRVKSLRDLGLTDEEILYWGEWILSVQMVGFLLGGILWGVLGDRLGRRTILFGSILLYSVANLANAMVWDVYSYIVIRFFAGLGLAGELGAAVTLVSEMLPTRLRGYGTMLVATVGLLGAVAAGIFADLLPWRAMYILGGVLGFLLLVGRAKLLESGMFEALVREYRGVRRGDFLALFTSWDRFSRYLRGILIGVPIWYSVAIFIVFAPELAKELGVRGEVDAVWAVMWCYLGVSVGDFLSGTLSQILRSRRYAVLVFLTFLVVMVLVMAFSRGVSVRMFYFLCFLLGVSTGYWAVFITIAAEQFGTNLRATVATSTPNFVRGSASIVTLAFQALRQHFSLVVSGLIIGAVVIPLAYLSVLTLKETFHRDLDFVEDID